MLQYPSCLEAVFTGNRAKRIKLVRRLATGDLSVMGKTLFQRPDDASGVAREATPSLVEELLVELVESQVIDIDEFTAVIFETVSPSEETISGRYISVMLALLDRAIDAERKAGEMALAIQLIEEIESSQVRERLTAIVERGR